MSETKLKVNEIFYSIQGEGANVGMPAVFIRLSGCNLTCDFCDTTHISCKLHTPREILEIIKDFGCKNIIWTGGEPTLQLTNKILDYFRDYYNCIETNGTSKVSDLIDYIAVSPKVSIDVLQKNFSRGVNEFRYPIKMGDRISDVRMLPRAQHYYLSPIDINQENIDYCIKFIKENPRWKLSIQMHKLLKIQ